MTEAPVETTAPPAPTETKPSPPTKYLVLAEAESAQKWVEVGIYEARTPLKAIEQAMKAAGRTEGTFAATPHSKWTVKSPKTETVERVVWG
jgi:hypothetical protein